MGATIVIDDALMDDAMRLSGVKTKREAVERALRPLTLLGKQKKIRNLSGKLKWEGNLDELRTDH